MAGKDKTITIDLNSLTAQELIDAKALVASCGVDLAEDILTPSLPTIAALTYIVMRRTEPRITYARCFRIAQRTWEVQHGA